MNNQYEYLHRNQLVAKAIGIRANAEAARIRLLDMKNPPKWLVKSLDGIIDRAEPLPKALAQYRDQAK